MNFSVHILLTTYFMAGLGVVSAGLVKSIDPVFTAAVAGLGISSFILNLRGRHIIPPRLWTVFAVFLFSFFILDYLSISRDLLVAASRFLMVLLALKLFDLKRIRDHLMVFSLASIQIIAAATATTSMLFFLILSLFIIGGIWSMILMTIKRDWHYARIMKGKTDAEVPGGVLGPGFIVSVIVLAFVSLVITMSIFFIMPRMGVGLFQSKSLGSVKVSGFSETMDMGSIGPVKVDKTVVMRVEVPLYQATGTPPEGPIYMRGQALASYDGRSWSRVKGKRRLVRKNHRGNFRIREADDMLIEQNILLEPLDTEVLFGLPHPVMLTDTPPSRDLTNLWTDAEGAVYLPSPPFTKIDYTVWSSPGPVKADPSTVGPEYLDTSYMEDVEDRGRIRDLVDELASGHEEPMDKALSMTNFLKGGFSYTLDPKPSEGRDVVADLLFYSKEGFCEHYATTLAVMLRVAGIPSRVITGFIVSEWNEYGGYYIVRQQDSHTWVEAYMNGAWVRFDPTPPPGFAPFYEPSRITLYMDLLRWRWNRYVVHFSGEDQVRIAAGLENKANALVSSMREGFKSTKSAASQLVLYLAAAAAALFLVYMEAKRLLNRKAAGRNKTPAYYAEMLKVLEKKGYEKGASETPLEFARRVGAEEVLDVTKVFLDDRYGEMPPDAEKARGVKDKIDMMRKGTPARA